ncbi:MAG: CoA transferase, partial [Variovorax sp.]
LAARLATFQRETLLGKLAAVGVPGGPINALDQVFADPQVVARGMRIDLPSPDGAIPSVRTPVLFSGEPAIAGRAAPRLGADTAAVLGELGLDAAKIERLRAAGVVGGAER